ncbi:phycobilisome linker polypeptide [Calothrix rhizosoleniae]|uniref:phycobilisome linker polypeptide n=1 Tax=Calothrix rhizosoleniae TaxID=888997 RepID=UPI000B49B54B|nr:phycobilisome linker polypeptide [Calothrix rhizosoleniae]
MAGMTTTGLPKFSDYSDRNVVIEITGLCRQDVMKTSNYEMKVPFNRMSQAMQTIHRMGGKVANIRVDSPSNGQG